LTVSLVPLAARAGDPAVKCESGKLKESSKYAACRLKADAKAVTKGIAADYTKCEAKFTDKWAKTENKAGVGICPSEGDQVSMDARITTDAAEVATLLAGGAVAPPQYFPATGQTTVHGAGSDGDVQAGAALSYADNADGTITDLNTGLMWAKKNDSGGIHDKDQEYTWSTGTNDMDGTIKTVFLDALNDVAGAGAACFAGHCDWRVPNFKELVSILDLENNNPTVDPAFHQSATCTGCVDLTVVTCSCTASSSYWTATSTPDSLNSALNVYFDAAITDDGNKTAADHVRAVRGGL
jgi:hypothetical protein